MGLVERAAHSVREVTGTHAKAVAELERLVEKDPRDTRALLRLAELHAKCGDSSLACETYARAGDILVRGGFLRRAISCFAQAQTVARQAGLLERIAPIARAIGKLYMKEKLVRDAVTALDSAARFLIERGADAQALGLLEERIAIDAGEVARVRLAETLFRLGDPAKGAEELIGVFHTLHAQRRRDEALDVAERLLPQRRDVSIARTAAELYLARNRPGDAFLALSKLRICCDDDPSNLPTLELLARAFDLAGHPEKATRVRREIGFLAQRAGDGARADAAFSRVPAGRRVTIDEPSGPRAPSVAEAPARREDSIVVEIDAAWDDLLMEAAAVPVPAESTGRMDPSRASFWPEDDGPSPDASGSVVSVTLADVELVEGDAPVGNGERPASMLETALECIESLVAQGRYQEAAELVNRYIAIRPRNPLLLERKAEIEEMKNAHHEGPPPNLFGFTPRKAETAQAKSVKAS